MINQLRCEREALIKLYVIAARLRMFPVTFDDHFELVGAVDECRSILEPPVDLISPEVGERTKAGTKADGYEKLQTELDRFHSENRELRAALEEACDIADLASRIGQSPTANLKRIPRISTLRQTAPSKESGK